MTIPDFGIPLIECKDYSVYVKELGDRYALMVSSETTSPRSATLFLEAATFSLDEYKQLYIHTDNPFYTAEYVDGTNGETRQVPSLGKPGRLSVMFHPNLNLVLRSSDKDLPYQTVVITEVELKKLEKIVKFLEEGKAKENNLCSVVNEDLQVISSNIPLPTADYEALSAAETLDDYLKLLRSN